MLGLVAYGSAKLKIGDMCTNGCALNEENSFCGKRKLDSKECIGCVCFKQMSYSLKKMALDMIFSLYRMHDNFFSFFLSLYLHIHFKIIDTLIY